MIRQIHAWLDSAYLPVMWTLTILTALFGLTALLAPDRARALCQAFTHEKRVRISGILLLFVGTVMFVGCQDVHPNLLLPIMLVGMAAFVKGGVQIVMPSVSVTMLDWWSEKSNPAHRTVGLLTLAVAVFYYFGTQTMPAAQIPEGTARPAASANGPENELQTPEEATDADSAPADIDSQSADLPDDAEASAGST